MVAKLLTYYAIFATFTCIYQLQLDPTSTYQIKLISTSIYWLQLVCTRFYGKPHYYFYYYIIIIYNSLVFVPCMLTDPEQASAREAAREAARQRMQAQLDAQAARHAEQMKQVLELRNHIFLWCLFFAEMLFFAVHVSDDTGTWCKMSLVKIYIILSMLVHVCSSEHRLLMRPWIDYPLSYFKAAVLQNILKKYKFWSTNYKFTNTNYKLQTTNFSKYFFKYI